MSQLCRSNQNFFTKCWNLLSIGKLWKCALGKHLLVAGVTSCCQFICLSIIIWGFAWRVLLSSVIILVLMHWSPLVLWEPFLDALLGDPWCAWIGIMGRLLSFWGVAGVGVLLGWPLIWGRGLPLGYNSMKFRNFPYIS